MNKPNVGFALCGSFCTFARVLPVMRSLSRKYNVIPIMSFNAYTTDTRFGKAEEINREIRDICGKEIVHTIFDAEPIGPKKLLDALIIEPCTGNTLAKLACGIADTPVTLAAKSHLRNARPLIIAVSTNDALAGAAKNIGALQNYRNVYFVPYAQDDSAEKPTSAVARFEQTEETLLAALNGRQLQPVLQGKE